MLGIDQKMSMSFLEVNMMKMCLFWKIMSFLTDLQIKIVRKHSFVSLILCQFNLLKGHLCGLSVNDSVV